MFAKVHFTTLVSNLQKTGARSAAHRPFITNKTTAMVRLAEKITKSSIVIHPL